jgi:hypothetical protein
MYYVSGIVKDEKGVGIARVAVSNGKKGVFTDKDGNYQIDTDVYNNKIRLSKSGYQSQVIDLTQYQNDSSVNGNVTLKSISGEVLETSYDDKSKENVESKGLSKKQMKVIGFSLLGVALILTSILVYKAIKKQ